MNPQKDWLHRVLFLISALATLLLVLLAIYFIIDFILIL
ncbi:hypothetical protein B2K_19205 [Paenibacillus mucilaginosus K02]|uniref:Uncharacterized protein n=1 Tax=Paenibacillus mucilaginosus K02 TaxID=997761 RepID=I0BKC1_9BACL|nr:hypothetical protein B2K_19205 [Paenibacillus mucilaginosus K02]